MRRVPALFSVLVLVVVAGCTTTSEGEPLPVTTEKTTSTGDMPSTSSGQQLPFAGAPKVHAPLDTGRFQQDPCRALTTEQVQSLDFPPVGEARDAPFGKACTWSNRDTGGRATVHFLDRDPRGLSAEYQAHEDGKVAFFDELPLIEGYPAIVSNLEDDRSIGRCTVVVGVSDQVRFEVPIWLSQVNIGTKDPCEIAVMVAGLALQTMKES